MNESSFALATLFSKNFWDGFRNACQHGQKAHNAKNLMGAPSGPFLGGGP